MPRNPGFAAHMHELTLAERLAQPDRCQERWYRWLAEQLSACSALDAGAGTGYGVEILRAAGAEAEGFDLLPAGPLVQQARIEDYPAQSFDWVVALDVLEHVEDDAGFLVQMRRAARFGVFFSTPNWNQWGSQNPYHIRDYTPEELMGLVGQPAVYWSATMNPAWPMRSAGALAYDDLSAYFGVELSVFRGRSGE